jgi:putative tricarboxylic transport membrane protein
METALRQSMIMSSGHFAIFINRPVAGSLVTVALFVGLWPAMTAVFAGWRRHRPDMQAPQPAE